VIHEAVLAACDALDGVKDGLLQDPTRCRFDPQTIACKQGDAPGCLTTKQVESVRTVLNPVKSRTGELIFPGYQPGTELAWDHLLAGPNPYAPALDQYKYLVFQDSNWDWRTFDIDRDVARADQVNKGTLSYVDADLAGFVGRGGKLLMYHGWSDQSIAPMTSVNYYESLTQKLGGAQKTIASARLFMVPGMGHCRGGEGPDTFDKVAALEAWVERGQVPSKIIASKSAGGTVTRTRPLCPYPQVAVYSGKSSVDDAANFACAMK
jgi:feruloyl esterase